MALGKDYEDQDCNLARALELVGERWTLLVVRDAFYGVRRFKDFQVHLRIPRAVLTERLNRLVAAGILRKRPDRGRHEYVLTETGIDLWPAVFTLGQWAQRHLPDVPTYRIYQHAACGTELDHLGACPACERVVPAREIQMSPGPGARRDDPVSRALNKTHPLLHPLQVD